MIATFCFIVSVIIFYKKRRICRERVYYAAAKFVSAGFVIFGALCVQRLAFGVACITAVFGVKITVGVHARHIIHGTGYGSFNAGIQRGGVQCHAAPAANANNAYFIGVNHFICRKVVYCCLKVLGVNIGRSHIAGLPAAFTGKGRVEGNS